MVDCKGMKYIIGTMKPYFDLKEQSLKISNRNSFLGEKNVKIMQVRMKYHNK